MGNHFGKCALCGKECELTFEHIPPRKAFNWIPEKTYSGDQLINTVAEVNRNTWDFSGLKYNNDQKGSGAYSLCQSCNNLTGTWYGDDYVTFAKNFHYMMEKHKPNVGQSVYVKAKLKPLPIIKQVSSMFCSINNFGGTDAPIQGLREFVLDKESNAFPKDNFRIGMYLFSGGIRRRCPYTVRCIMSSQGPVIETISEIATYPLGFILYSDPPENLRMPYTEITSFADFAYDEEYSLEMIVPVYECNIMFPGDFRSKAEIEQCTEESIKWEEDHIDELSILHGLTENNVGEDLSVSTPSL